MNWKDDLRRKFLQRNRDDFEEVEYYCLSSEQLWRKNNRWDSQRVNLRHKLNLMEFESSDSSMRANPLMAVSSLRKKLDNLHCELNEYESPPKLNLSKIIHDQKTMLSHQAEELGLAQLELRKAFEQIVSLTSKIDEAQKHSDKESGPT